MRFGLVKSSLLSRSFKNCIVAIHVKLNLVPVHIRSETRLAWPASNFRCMCWAHLDHSGPIWTLVMSSRRPNAHDHHQRRDWHLQYGRGHILVLQKVVGCAVAGCFTKERDNDALSLTRKTNENHPFVEESGKLSSNRAFRFPRLLFQGLCPDAHRATIGRTRVVRQWVVQPCRSRARWRHRNVWRQGTLVSQHEQNMPTRLSGKASRSTTRFRVAVPATSWSERWKDVACGFQELPPKKPTTKSPVPSDHWPRTKNIQQPHSTSIRKGPAIWQENPTKAMKPFDCITAVNGTSVKCWKHHCLPQIPARRGGRHVDFGFNKKYLERI